MQKNGTDLSSSCADLLTVSWTVQEVSLPPDCGSERGCWLRAQAPPSIERFWLDFMQTDQPVLVSGELSDPCPCCIPI